MLKVVDLRSELAHLWHPPGYPAIRTRDYPIQGIVVHSTADEDRVDQNKEDDVFRIARYDTSPNNHITPGTPLATITYTHFVEYDRNGTLVCWRTLDDNVRTSHAGDVTYHKYRWNSLYTSVVVCHSPADHPDQRKMDMLVDVVAMRCLQYGWDPVDLIAEQDEKAPRVVFHRELRGTGWIGTDGKKYLRKECPDHAWDPDEFRRNVCARILAVVEPYRDALGHAGFTWSTYRDLVGGARGPFVENTKRSLGIPPESRESEGIVTERMIGALCQAYGLDFFV